MAKEERVRLTVNGASMEVSVDPDTPLLYVLRGPLGLKGARFGCGEGVCGACSVIADGKAVRACDVPVGTLAGASIETVEGLSASPRHPLIEAVIERQAAQCGYCLPGIIMNAKALLDRTPRPSRREIAAALDDNLCRCGTHVRILDAIERAAARMAETAR
ncbi:(2Fe-2S)-binding protein [Acuticoccus kandeliae]|uniref:(2Fe-2S)-binding protein n=1 Tax=Acuticoccus kandeliae TaxID=2073160 RepID=UPI000D3E1BAE|nr:(2Fe-2S)-binding protein [Acuticoccus kandeliae]